MTTIAEVQHGSNPRTNTNDSSGTVAHVMDFDEIVEKHTGFVYNVVYRMMGNHHDAEEVVQEAFISAYRARDSFRGDAKPTTWLYRIAVNAALMRIRKDKRHKNVAVSDDERPDLPSNDWADSPEAVVASTELGERIQAAITELPEDLRIAVILRDVQGLSNLEAAEVVDVSISAVKARLHRGRVALREILRPYMAGRRTQTRTTVIKVS